IVVVGAAPQEGAALPNAHDARERAVASRGVADQPHEIAGHDRGAAQLPDTHRGHRPLPVRALGEHGPPPPAVHGDRAGGDGVLVLGPVLRARARAAPLRADADVALVVLPRGAPHASSAPGSGCSIDSHIPTKSGRVFCVVPMSTTRRSATRSPRIAPAVAMRWSS